MKEVREDWTSRSKKGDTIWIPITKKGEPEQEINTFTLQGIPIEYPLEMTREYLWKYVEEPDVMRATIPERPHLFNGDLLVKHEGMKIKIENRIWVGPGISAWVKGLTQRPMSEWRPKCMKCQELGHLAPNCTNAERCSKCKTEGHHVRECKWCPICRRIGHDMAMCVHNPEAASPDQDENTLNRERRSKQRQTESEYHKILKSLTAHTQQDTEQMDELPTNTRYAILLESCPDCNRHMKGGEMYCLRPNRGRKQQKHQDLNPTNHRSGKLSCLQPACGKRTGTGKGRKNGKEKEDSEEGRQTKGGTIHR